MRPQSSRAESDDDQPPKTASRIMTSVRRSLLGSTPKTRSQKVTSPLYLTVALHSHRFQRTGMISTPAESSPPIYTRDRDHDPSTSRPTIEQIAMGLHISRTPHFRPLSAGSGSYYSQRSHSSGSLNLHHHHHLHHTHPYDKSSSRPFALPPPPLRSSMKQRGSSNPTPAIPSRTSASPPASVSSTTVTSHLSPSSHSSSSSSFLKFRVPRFFPRHRNASSAPSSVSSAGSSPHASADLLPPKKAVRFSSQSSLPETDIQA